MFINRSKDGKNNVCGENIARYRKNLNPPVSQRAFADLLQLEGVDLMKNAIQRIESGQRFVTDIELVAIAKVLRCTVDDLVRSQ